MFEKAVVSVILALFLSMAWAPAATAQEEGQRTVFATVNGKDITVAEIDLAADLVGADLLLLPENERVTTLMNLLISQRLFADLARQAGVDGEEVFERRMDYYTDKALRDAYVETVLANEITESDIEARYDEEIAKLPHRDVLSTRHILVATEAEARDLSKLIEDGADFAELSLAHSIDAEGGSDSVSFNPGTVVPALSGVVRSLDVGEVSPPVESASGWYLVKLEDRRPATPPALEDVRDKIAALILRDRVSAKTAELLSKVSIKLVPFPDATAQDGAATESNSTR